VFRYAVCGAHLHPLGDGPQADVLRSEDDDVAPAKPLVLIGCPLRCAERCARYSFRLLTWRPPKIVADEGRPWTRRC